MPRLPSPGRDNNVWGDILNDYLSVEHNADGSQKPLPQSAIINLTTDLAAKADDADLAGKVDSTRTINGHALSSDVIVAKADLGLANVDNTSDANKPISTATTTALNLKEDRANKDADGTLAANSDTKYSSQKATKTYIDTQLAAGTNPTGSAAGVLSGTYPNPGFAADMATQAELDGEAVARINADTLLVPKSVVDAKGDLIVATADNTPVRLGVGSDRQVLMADTTAATGVKWIDAGLTNRGAWDSGNTYAINDVVTYQGSSYYFTTPVAPGRAMPEYIGGNASAIYNNNNGSLGLPVGAVAGDLVVLTVDGMSNESTTLGTTSWTTLLTMDGGVGLYHARKMIFSRLLASADITAGNLNFTNISGAWFASLRVYRFVDTTVITTAINPTTTVAANGSLGAQAITPSTFPAMAVSYWSLSQDTYPVAPTWASAPQNGQLGGVGDRFIEGGARDQNLTSGASSAAPNLNNNNSITMFAAQATIALPGATGLFPSSSVAVLASKGSTGAPGATGAMGSTGATGPTGSTHWSPILTPLGLWTPSDEATADGTATAAWSDRSGGGLHLRAGISTTKPLVKTNVQNGFRGYLFDGVNDIVESADSSVLAALKPPQVTCLVVFRPLSVATPQFILCCDRDTSGSSVSWGITIASGSLAASFNINGSSQSPSHAVSLIAGTTYTGTVRYDGANIMVQLNAAGRVSEAVSGEISYDGTQPFCIGDLPFNRGSTPQIPYNGYIFEVVVFGGALNDTDLAAEELRLKNKWAHY